MYFQTVKMKKCEFCDARSNEEGVTVLKLSADMVKSLGWHQNRPYYICLGHFEIPPVTKGEGENSRKRWRSDAKLPKELVELARQREDPSFDSDDDTYEEIFDLTGGLEDEEVSERKKEVEWEATEVDDGFEDSQEPEDKEIEDEDWSQSSEVEDSEDISQESQPHSGSQQYRCANLFLDLSCLSGCPLWRGEASPLCIESTREQPKGHSLLAYIRSDRISVHGRNPLSVC